MSDSEFPRAESSLSERTRSTVVSAEVAAADLGGRLEVAFEVGLDELED
jgi:hypothetical protein